MWTEENRARYDRSGLRYESDLTDAEWALVAPLIPPAKHGGAKRTVDVREILNGLGSVEDQGFPACVGVLEAAHGAICSDGCAMGEDGATLSG
jgi:hypothetical protein